MFKQTLQANWCSSRPFRPTGVQADETSSQKYTRFTAYLCFFLYISREREGEREREREREEYFARTNHKVHEELFSKIMNPLSFLSINIIILVNETTLS